MALDHVIISSTDSNVIYAAAWNVQSPHNDGDLFRSRDGGKTWETLSGMHGKSIRALALAPSDARILVAGALDGVFRSRDRGDHWERISPANHAEIKNIESLAIDPVDPAVIYAGTWHLPWKTEDGGKTWRSIKTGVIDDSDVFSIVVDYAHPSIVYMSACSGIYKSTNSGQLFRKVQGIPYSARRTRALQIDPATPGTLYAGTTEGLWKSSDGGSTWKRLTSANVIVNAVLVDSRAPSRVLLATDRGGVLASDDGGASFTASNRGFTHRQVASLLVDETDPSVMYAGVLNDKEFGGVFISRDAGITWTQMSDGLQGRDVFVLKQSEQGTVLAGTNSGIFEWQPGKSQWRTLNVFLPATGQEPAGELTAAVRGLEFFDGKLYAASSIGLLVSPDSGQSWRRVGPEIPDLISLYSDGRALVAVSRHGIVASMNGGEGWFAPGRPQSVSVINSAFVDGRGAIWLATHEGAFRSVDGGESWLRITSLPAVSFSAIQPDPQTRYILAVAAESGTIFATPNNGRSWESVKLGLPVHELRFARGRFVAATAFDGVVVQITASEALVDARSGSQ